MAPSTDSLRKDRPRAGGFRPSLRLRLRHRRLGMEKSALQWLHHAALRLGRIEPEQAHLETGKRGEFEALFYLRQQGYRMAERRWRTRGLNGDLDLIAWDGETLAFIEVKTRTKRDFFAAESSIDEAKRRMLFRMARAYTRTLPDWEKDPAPVRFDVVAVYLLDGKVEFTLTRDAFRPQGPGWTMSGN